MEEVKNKEFPTSEEILDKDFIEKYRNIQPNWGFSGLGYVVYKRTYARLKENGTTEEWPETIERCIRGAQRIGTCYTKKEAERLFDYIFNLKCCFAGRSLWQLGTSTVDRFGANSLQNCFYTDIVKLEDFLFIFEALMLGSGMGFSVRREHIHNLPKIKFNVKIEHIGSKDTDFIVPDSREGWVELLKKVLEAFFKTGKGFTYSTILVRGYGEKIRGFGGTASGPTILIDGIDKICKIFLNREGKKLRSVDVLDICNIIGMIVVSGNVRRTATLALGDADDVLFLRAKRWDLGNIPNHRAMSNNTIDADSYDYITPEFWKGYEGHGEPYGLFNTKLTQTQGRLGEFIKDSANGTNACGEISLEGGSNIDSVNGGGEACNLGTLYLNNIESKEELFECSELLYKAQKAICALNFIHDGSNKIIHKNFRLGQSVTGVCQSLDKLEWLNDCYKNLRTIDKEWSKLKNWPESIKLTTCQPSGTLSLLSGSTPGVHPGFSPFYIRRVRMSSDDKLVKLCKDMGYHTEYVKNFDGTDDHKTIVIEFPCKLDSKAIITKDMSAIKQLELVKKLQSVWSDNAVSATVYYKPDELTEVKNWLKENYNSSIKSVSFLLFQNHGFVQAPYQDIEENQYQGIVKHIKPLTSLIDNGIGNMENLECSNGSCPIK